MTCQLHPNGVNCLSSHVLGPVLAGWMVTAELDVIAIDLQWGVASKRTSDASKRAPETKDSQNRTIFEQRSAQIALEEATGGVRTSQALSASRQLLGVFDCAATCASTEVQQGLIFRFTYRFLTP